MVRAEIKERMDRMKSGRPSGHKHPESIWLPLKQKRVQRTLRLVHGAIVNYTIGLACAVVLMPLLDTVAVLLFVFKDAKIRLLHFQDDVDLEAYAHMRDVVKLVFSTIPGAVLTSVVYALGNRPSEGIIYTRSIFVASLLTAHLFILWVWCSMLYAVSSSAKEEIERDQARWTEGGDKHKERPRVPEGVEKDGWRSEERMKEEERRTKEELKKERGGGMEEVKVQGNRTKEEVENKKTQSIFKVRWRLSPVLPFVTATKEEVKVKGGIRRVWDHFWHVMTGQTLQKNEEQEDREEPAAATAQLVRATCILCPVVCAVLLEIYSDKLP